MRRWLTGLLLLLATQSAAGAACGKPGGANIYEKRDGGGFVMDLYLGKRDVRFTLPGQRFRRDDGAPPGKFAFHLDDLYLQVVTTPVALLHEGEPRPDDATLLRRHAAWETKYWIEHAGDNGGRLEDLGAQKLDGRPLTMLVWRSVGIGGRGMQYWVTTVVDADVVVLTAILPAGMPQDAQFRDLLAEYSGSFDFLDPKECVVRGG